MNRIIALFLALSCSGLAYSQTNFRTNATGGGNWNANSTWQVESPDGSGNWAPATSTPTSASYLVTVRSPDVVIVTVGVTVDQVTIQSGATLTVNDGIALTLNDGIGTDLSVSGNLRMIGESFLTGAGNIITNLNGNLFLGSLNANGAIVTGTTEGNFRIASRGYAAGSQIFYNGTGPQFLGNGHPITAGTKAFIDNSFGVSLNNTSVQLVTIGNDLTISSGTFTIQNNSLRVLGSVIAASPINFNSAATARTFAVSGDLNMNGGSLSVTSGSGTAALTVTGNLNLTGGTATVTSGSAASTLAVIGTLNLATAGLTITSGSGSATVNVTGDISGAQLIQSSGSNSFVVINGTGALSNAFPLASATTIRQITWNRSGGTLTFPYSLNLTDLSVTAGNVATNVDLIFPGNLNLAGGTLFTFNNRTLTLQGLFNNILSGGQLAGNSTSNLNITGSGILGTLAFAPAGNAINSLTLNRPTAGNLVTLNSALTLNVAFNLTDGDFVNTSGLNFASDLQLNRHSNAALTGAAPTGGPYDVIYSGSFLTTGSELGGPVRHITSNCSATVSVGTGGFTSTGILAINSGIVLCGANSISIGSLVNLSTLNAPSTNLTMTGNFDNNGTFNHNNGTIIFNGISSILGSSTPTFQSITISGTLNGGTGLALQGNFTNNGTFNGGSSVVQFLSGSAQAIQGTSASSFASFTVNKTAATTLTISSAVSVATGVDLTVGRINNSSGLLTMGVASIFTRASGTTFIGVAPAGGAYNLIYNGTSMSTSAEAQGSLMNVSNNLSFTLTASVAMSIPGALNLNSGVLSNASGLVTMGNGAIIIRNGTATFTGVAPAGGPYDITYNAGSNISTGTEAAGSLRNVTKNLAGTLTLSAAISIPATLTLNAGIVSNPASFVTMGNGATITRNSAGSITGSVPLGGPYNLIYTGTSLSTLVEAQGSLNDVTSNLSGTVTQTIALTSAGTFRVNSGIWTAGANTIATGGVTIVGTLNAPGTTLTLTGNFTNNGTFNHNLGTVIFNGISTLPGSVVSSFRDIQLNTLRTLTFPAAVNVAGNIVFASGSTFNHGSGIITINGSSTQNIDGQGARFYGITVNKGGGTVDLLSSLPLANVLLINSATTVNSGGFLTVLSQPNGPGSATDNDGSIGPIAAGGSVAGNVIVQRFMIAKGLGNRYISPAVSGVGFSDLSDDFNIASGYIRYYNEPTRGAIGLGYLNVTSATMPLQQGRGYLAYMDTNVDIMWDVTGTINAGSIGMPVTYTNSPGPVPAADGWNLVGNPYPAPIVWNNNGAAWSRTNVDPIITVYDIAGSASYTYNYTNGSGSLPNGIIATGQSFWVHLSAPGSLTISEPAKVSGIGGSFFRNRNSVPEQLTVGLSDGTFTDHSTLVIDENATSGFDRLYDGYKFMGEKINVYFADKEGRHLVMNAVNEITSSFIVPIEVQVNEPGQYTLQFSGQETLSSSSKLYLIDELEHKMIPISGLREYPFVVSQSLTVTERFYLAANENESNQTPGQFLVAYPNPTSDYVHLRGVGEGAVEFSMLDFCGKIVTSGICKDGDEIDVRGYAKGMYLLKVRTSQGMAVMKIFKKD